MGASYNYLIFGFARHHVVKKVHLAIKPSIQRQSLKKPLQGLKRKRYLLKQGDEALNLMFRGVPL
jgi:hypothetical protein